MEIVVGAVSDKGNVKPTNQDNFLVKIYENNNQDIGLFVMCDGMGGLSFGEVASSISVKSFKEWFDKNYERVINEKDENQIINFMVKVIEVVNKKIREYGEKELAKVGTTISALLLCKDKYYIVHVGDSRIYKINKEIKQLTEDHTLVAMNVKNNIMTEDEAKSSARKNILTQCVGVKENIEVFKQYGRINKNDVFILCCDGLYNKFEEKELYDEIKKIKNAIDNDVLQNTAQEFVNRVKERGEKDNISVIIVGFVSDEGFIEKLKKHVGF
ncbi:PP2C family protein-serine/threonine phosphatase [Clostridium felsineum]|uniref:Serine/threonine phosphatase stp n=1 Tax=Clostridium felsineum TaxID=36839 RepID=A0A1S8MGQ2_9CLOT|nr:PP2C family serine/threonine-protein phosphatase [Clostridium felsineum]MCR3760724.1 serine/threonine-protein phosphatase [Clostridium felsineum]URZ03922.1 Serine/threonine phosphatase stp [Clostridium felsineum]URZ07807.1 Serine/threonine phosphatase stp [Clostridium felsineum]URZ12838.1 Serine/threonine phosphatase stp [Clostridium felsineum]URZ15194.1 Serine/threonine phosphatase stp [Clostridium felsineum DSM 794]